MASCDGGAAPASPQRRTRNSGNQEIWKSTDWRIRNMKVTPCRKRYAHDWTTCPFAHPRDAARRRDLQKYQYTGIACPSMKQDGQCPLEDACPYAHNVFEYWLHPTRYRTQMCNDGESCRRFLCFFAHNDEELRVAPRPWLPSPDMLTAAAGQAATRAADAHAGAAQQRQSTPSRSGDQSLHLATGCHTQVQEQGQTPHGHVQLPLAAAAVHCQPLDAAVQCPGDVAVLQAPSSPQQHTPGRQGNPQALVELLLGMVERGEVGADDSAALLRSLLSPAEVARLQAELARDEGQSRRFSDPLPASACRHPPGQPTVPFSAGNVWHSRTPSFGGLSGAGWLAPPSQLTAYSAAQARLSAQKVEPGSLLGRLAAIQTGAAGPVDTHDMLALSAAAHLLSACAEAASPSLLDSPGSIASVDGTLCGAASLDSQQSSLGSATASLVDVSAISACSAVATPDRASLLDCFSPEVEGERKGMAALARLGDAPGWMLSLPALHGLRVPEPVGCSPSLWA